MTTFFRILALIALLYMTEGIQKAMGNPMKQARPVKAFENVVLEAGDNAVIQIREAKIAGVTIKAEAALVSKVKTTVAGNTLTLHLDENYFDDGRVEIFIQLPVLKKLSLSGGGNVQIAGANIADKLETIITGGGHIRFEQKTRVQNLNGRITGGGTVEALNLTAETADILVVGGGEVMLQVSEALTGQIIGGGNIWYEGDPHVSSQITGGGRVASRQTFPVL